MRVEFVYKFLPILYIETDSIQAKCVTSYGPIIVSEKYSKCASKKRLHLEYAKQFYRTWCLRPLLCLSTTKRIELDIEVHARQLLEYTGFSHKEMDKEFSYRAKLIWSLSANRSIEEQTIKRMLQDRLYTLQREKQNASQID
jgi:hypothetical protein